MTEQKKKTKALAPIEEVRHTLLKMEPQFLKVLPKDIAPEKFARIIYTAVQKTPKLMECTRQSLWSAAMDAATDGLLPDAREGVIIPYKNQAKWLPMIGGIFKKVYRSQMIASVSVHVVYTNEKFESWTDEKGEHFTYKPLFVNRGEPYLAFAAAWIKGEGAPILEIMTKEEIEMIEAKSPSRNSADSPWKNWKGEMWRKTVFRRLAKKLPTSTELLTLVNRDDFLYEEREVNERPRLEASSKRLKNLVKGESVAKEEKEAKETKEGPEFSGQAGEQPSFDEFHEDDF